MEKRIQKDNCGYYFNMEEEIRLLKSFQNLLLLDINIKFR